MVARATFCDNSLRDCCVLFIDTFGGILHFFFFRASPTTAKPPTVMLLIEKVQLWCGDRDAVQFSKKYEGCFGDSLSIFGKKYIEMVISHVLFVSCRLNAFD
jgi:hypothetical protein